MKDYRVRQEIWVKIEMDMDGIDDGMGVIFESMTSSFTVPFELIIQANDFQTLKENLNTPEDFYFLLSPTNLGEDEFKIQRIRTYVYSAGGQLLYEDEENF